MNKLILILGIIVFVSCKKGDKGDPGTDGNANVVQYNFGEQNLLANTFVTLQINTTEDTLNNSHWYVYLFAETLNRWYQIPGHGQGGTTEYRVSTGFSAGKANIYIDKIGPGERYAKARVIRVYANRQQTPP
ncbi:MAG: hypothetical protein ACTHMC_09615 [Pseudobacter sp.]|uniref:hypothetical protein n=1 Tax=Pseudobacter sp. TaxID=2045420 RepID=UPI003F81D937